MQLFIEPIGERALVQNSEFFEGSAADLIDQLELFADDLDLVDILRDDGDEKSLAAVAEFEAAVRSNDLAALTAWINGQTDEYTVRFTD